MTFEEFLKLSCTSDFILLNEISQKADIPVEYVSILEPPVEKFVRPHEIILSTALSVRENHDELMNFIAEVQASGAAAIVFAFPDNDASPLTDDILTHFEKLGFPILTMEWKHLFSDVVEETLKAIWQKESEMQSYLESLQRELLNYFIQGKNLDDAAELLYKYLACDIVILDTNHKIMGRNRNIRNLSSSGFLNSRTGDVERIEIATTGRLYGYLILDATTRALTLHTPAAIQCINTPLTLWFDREYSIMASNMKSIEDFVWKLANHEFNSVQDASSKADYLGLNTTASYACFAAEISDDTISAPHDTLTEQGGFSLRLNGTSIEEQVLLAAENMKLHVMTSLHLNSLVIFLEADLMSDFKPRAEKYLDLLEQYIRQTIPSVHFMWGYDSTPRGLDTLSIGYKNAKEALELCRNSHGRLKRSCFQASILSKAVSLLQSDAEIQARSTAILSRLIDHDIAKNTDYIETLRTYINCNYNISETARLCSLHRQSLIYRLEKIEELCGMSLKNHEDLFLLELCLMSYYKEI